ncbi:hypothetical protein FB45DRAFT_1053668 [Roridomyces roridus]|uniref:F-box domain-containing protein n=1 Tax=Roridomyces roridus TaxID=1738132 RepID=A0AAD7FW91_9AGAR|nr:hypothetical protein FB45DRAFT_1053668 [Roridomyces roridus]
MSRPGGQLKTPFGTSPLLPDAAQSEHILSLLRSYSEPPSNMEATLSSLSDELERYDDEISRCENDIAALRARVEQASLERVTLEHHLHKCRSLLSPIRRMPPQVLTSVFALLKPDIKYDDTIVPLLRLSHVCARWYTIVTETPTLWDSIAIDQNAGQENAMMSLSLSLERSGTAPLHLCICGTDPGALSLLSNQSDRWRDVRIICPLSSDLHRLSSVAGKLPSLQILDICCLGQDDENRVDIFAAAPRLRVLRITGDVLAVSTIPPLEQLRSICCSNLHTTEALIRSLELMSRMLHGTTFGIEFFLANLLHDEDEDNDDADELLNFEPPTTTSNIRHLSMEITEYFAPQHCILVLNNTLKSLTLPYLSKLSFSTTEYPLTQIHWPHTGFMACAHRSSFQTTLESFLLKKVVITDVQLLACLAAVPSLQHLSIGDHQTIPRGEEKAYGVDYHLITDSLLSKLTLGTTVGSQQQPLIPNLRTLECNSRLKFDDGVFLDLVLSRRTVQPSTDTPPFTCEVECLVGHCREIDSAVSARLRELRVRREVIVRFSAGDLSDQWYLT